MVPPSCSSCAVAHSAGSVGQGAREAVLPLDLGAHQLHPCLLSSRRAEPAPALCCRNRWFQKHRWREQISAREDLLQASQLCSSPTLQGGGDGSAVKCEVAPYSVSVLPYRAKRGSGHLSCPWGPTQGHHVLPT